LTVDEVVELGINKDLTIKDFFFGGGERRCAILNRD